MPLDPYTLEQAEEDIATLRGQVQLLSEILQLSNGPTPNTPSAGTVDIFSSNGQPNYLNAAGLQMGFMGAQNATFPTTTVTQATLTNLATASYPGGDAEAGAIYELEVWGNGTQGSTAQALTFGVSFAGQSMITVPIGTSILPVNLIFRWQASARVICITAGTSGTFSSLVYGAVSTFNQNLNFAGNPTAGFTQTEATTTYTVNTNNSQTLALQASWGATTGAPTLTSRVAVFKRIA